MHVRLMLSQKVIYVDAMQGVEAFNDASATSAFWRPTDYMMMMIWRGRVRKRHWFWWIELSAEIIGAQCIHNQFNLWTIQNN